MDTIGRRSDMREMNCIVVRYLEEQRVQALRRERVITYRTHLLFQTCSFSAQFPKGRQKLLHLKVRNAVIGILPEGLDTSSSKWTRRGIPSSGLVLYHTGPAKGGLKGDHCSQIQPV